MQRVPVVLLFLPPMVNLIKLFCASMEVYLHLYVSSRLYSLCLRLSSDPIYFYASYS